MKKNLLFLVTSMAFLPASVALANPYADYNPRYNPTRGYGGGYDGYDAGGYGQPERPTHNGNANKQAYEQMMNNLNGGSRNNRELEQDPYYAQPQHYPAGQYGDEPRYEDNGYDRPQYDEQRAQREVDHAHHPSGYDSMGNEMGYDERQYRQDRYVETGERNALSGPPSGSVFRSTHAQSEQQRKQERNMQRGYDDSYQPIRKPQTQDTNRSRWR